jgi:catechol 2,3-dioxygenase-like lactoylglutathione lyase family enzyme
MRLEHVNLTVSDLDRSVDFYARLLDLRVRWRRPASDDLPAAAHVGDDRQYIAMFEAEAGAARPVDDYGAVGLNHFGLVVDDLDAVRERLRGLGFEPHSEADYDPGRRFYFRDPDGIEVEIVQYEPAATPA